MHGKWWRRSGTVVCGALLLVVLGPQRLPAGEVVQDGGVAEALLAQPVDWQQVAAHCGTVGPKTTAALRALKGHACLARNDNNTAWQLFLSLDTAEARREWHRWTERFVSDHPERAVAHYLVGDALGRLGQWAKAKEAYGAALKINPDCALSWNGLGVAHALCAAGATTAEAREQAYDAALECLETACEKGPTFADAWASRGTLMVMKRVADEAATSFERALTLCPGFALALNGRGCAWFGRAHVDTAWEKANADFAAAGRAAPSPIVVWNLHALAVAAENARVPEQMNTPLFRASDFLDWESLRRATQRSDDVFRLFYGGELPAEAAREVFDRMNQALENPSFFDQAKPRLDLSQAAPRLLALVTAPQPLRGQHAARRASADKEQIRLLNRLVLELAYPYLIAMHEQRNPGTQLTLSHGLMDSMQYRAGLSTRQIEAGQWRVDHLWRPLADAVSQIGIPVVGAFGDQLNRHLDVATRNNELTLAGRGIALDSVRPGGVSTEMRKRYLDRGDWPVLSCFGLAQEIALPGAAYTERQESTP